MSPGNSIRCPRMFESATFTSPAGSTPTARAAASAASAFARMCADVNGSVRPGGGGGGAVRAVVPRRDRQGQARRQLGDVAAGAERAGVPVGAPVRLEQRL